MKSRWRFILKLVSIVFCPFFYCEFLNYYVVIGQCSWPKFGNEDSTNNSIIKAMLLSDTHLLGPYRGHWFDKLRREWQMHRAFQSAITLHTPEVVFILGDLFDEGQWCNEAQFQEYVNRFFLLFETPKNMKMYVVPGNHDVGFHYATNLRLLNRFNKVFNFSSVEFLDIKGNYFVMINSMAMEGDGCFLCAGAEEKLKSIAGDLRCAKDKENCKKETKLKKYSRPIILQHFPMYRKSDFLCNEIDQAPSEIKNIRFREKWDCLSEQASKMIYDELNPRLIFAGHVHHGCHIVQQKDINEYTLPSFSWRNKNNPTFILAKFSPTGYAIRKCEIPKETTVIIIYAITVLSISAHIIFRAFYRKPSNIKTK